MKKRFDASLQERHHVHSSLFACRKHTPKPLQPTIAPIASCSLRHLSVNHHLANRLFRQIVRRRNTTLNKTKILLLPIPQPLRNKTTIVVVRNATPRCRKNRFPMIPHPGKPIAFQQIVSMNRLEHLVDRFQQAFSVLCDFPVLAFREKLHFANQMRPAELQRHIGQTIEFSVRTPEIARDDAIEILAEQFFQHDAPSRRIDVKHREAQGSQQPYPTFGTVLLAAGLVDVQVFFVRQLVDQFLIRYFQRIACFVDLFGKKSPRNGNPKSITEKVFQCRIRHVTPTFEISGQRDELGTEKSGFFDFRRQVGGVKALAMFAPIPGLAIFRNEKWFVDEFDLLMFFWRLVGDREFTAASRTDVELEWDGGVDLRFVEGCAKMLFVSLLCSAFSFLSAACFLFGRRDDVGGRRFGGVGRIFPERGDFGFESGDMFLERNDLFQSRFEKCFEFGDSFVFGVHEPYRTLFLLFHQYQFFHFTPHTP